MTDKVRFTVSYLDGEGVWVKTGIDYIPIPKGAVVNDVKILEILGGNGCEPENDVEALTRTVLRQAREIYYARRKLGMEGWLEVLAAKRKDPDGINFDVEGVND